MYYEMCDTSKATGWLVRQAPVSLVGGGTHADVSLGAVAWGVVKANGGNWKISQTRPENGLFSIPVHEVNA